MMTTTFRVLGLATALTLGAALAASAQTTNGSAPAVGTGQNGGISRTTPGARATTRQGLYQNRMRTGQNSAPRTPMNTPGNNGGIGTGDTGTGGSGTSGGAASGGGH